MELCREMKQGKEIWFYQVKQHHCPFKGMLYTSTVAKHVAYSSYPVIIPNIKSTIQYTQGYGKPLILITHVADHDLQLTYRNGQGRNR